MRSLRFWLEAVSHEKEHVLVQMSRFDALHPYEPYLCKMYLMFLKMFGWVSGVSRTKTVFFAKMYLMFLKMLAQWSEQNRYNVYIDE